MATKRLKDLLEARKPSGRESGGTFFLRKPINYCVFLQLMYISFFAASMNGNYLSIQVAMFFFT